MHVVTLDSVNFQKLIDLPNLKASLSRNDFKSTRMEEMSLLGKMDARRLMPKTENNNGCCTHECKHCGFLLKFTWKLKGSIKNAGGGGHSHHDACVGRHLEKHCNKGSRNSIKERTLENN